MSFNQDSLSKPDVIMFSATKQHSTPENTYSIDHHRHRSKDAEASQMPRRHSHHAPEFRRKSIDTLTHEQRFLAAQQRRGLNVMDTTDEDREFEEERQRIADESLRKEYERYMSLMQQHRYMTDMYVQQQSMTQSPPQSYADPVMMERTPSTAFNGRLSSSP
ncbi:hypothetical protein Unana1_05689 [Umbelopsis nana]